jgi:hypothetical protein
MNMIVRRASDDFDALMVADAMELVGADVISIVVDRKSLQDVTWHVFAKHSNDVPTKEIDKSISKMYDSLEAGSRLRKGI